MEPMLCPACRYKLSDTKQKYCANCGFESPSVEMFVNAAAYNTWKEKAKSINGYLEIERIRDSKNTTASEIKDKAETVNTVDVKRPLVNNSTKKESSRSQLTSSSHSSQNSKGNGAALTSYIFGNLSFWFGLLVAALYICVFIKDSFYSDTGYIYIHPFVLLSWILIGLIFSGTSMVAFIFAIAYGNHSKRTITGLVFGSIGLVIYVLLTPISIVLSFILEDLTFILM